MINKECLFCSMPKDRIIYSNKTIYAVRDFYPVTDLHTLIIPKRHFFSYFDILTEERNDLFNALDFQKAEIQSIDPLVTGFNIGINDGIDAGQSIMHCHIHLIPRRKGDASDPKGGVRGVIADKQKY
jgi:ATP adenylyltransferase